MMATTASAAMAPASKSWLIAYHKVIVSDESRIVAESLLILRIYYDQKGVESPDTERDTSHPDADS
jgi:hypothetical protein